MYVRLSNCYENLWHRSGYSPGVFLVTQFSKQLYFNKMENNITKNLTNHRDVVWETSVMTSAAQLLLTCRIVNVKCTSSRKVQPSTSARVRQRSSQPQHDPNNHVRPLFMLLLFPSTSALLHQVIQDTSTEHVL